MIGRRDIFYFFHYSASLLTFFLSLFGTYVLSAEQVERHDVENVASVANCFEKSRGKNVTSCDA